MADPHNEKARPVLERIAFFKLEAWILGLCIVLALSSGVLWGYGVAQWGVFPAHQITEIAKFVKGARADKRSVQQRLAAEVTYQPAAYPATSNSRLVPSKELTSVELAPNSGGDVPVLDGMSVYETEGPKRYFAIFGSFAFPKEKVNFGVLLMDNQGTVYRGWAIDPDEKDYEYRGPHIGLAVTNDGTVTTNVNGVLSGYGWCGEKQWEAPWSPHPDGKRRQHDSVEGYDWHHDILAQGGRLYTFRGAAVMEVDAHTGEVLREIHAADLLRWSLRDNLSVFEGRLRKPWYHPEKISRQHLNELFFPDPFHFNKVDVLSEKAAPLYPEFEAGDMLLSLRSLNLVTVIRPSEKRILWWRYGLVSRQHDASFIDGGIEVFDNNPVSLPPKPRIVRLDLDDQDAKTIFDLSRWKMVMRSKGNFERRKDRLLTVDDEAGRVIAGRLDGSIDFVFENGFPKKKRLIKLQLRDATEITPEQFARFQASCR